MTCWDYMTVESEEPLSNEALQEHGSRGWLLMCETKTFIGPGYLSRFARPLDPDADGFTPEGMPLVLAERLEKQTDPGHCRGAQ